MFRFWNGKEEDDRPATLAAIAVCNSLRNEPQRWRMIGDSLLVHDTAIAIDVDGWIRQPDLKGEPEANATLVQAAIDAWVSLRLFSRTPEPEPKA